MEAFSTSPVSEAPNLKHHSPHLLRIVLLIAVIVALLSMSYLTLVMKMPVPGFIGEYLSGLTLPAELRGATLVSDRGGEGSVLYRHQGGMFETEELGASLVSATTDATGSARIIRDADRIFSVLLDGKVVMRNKHPVVGIARSPSGTRVVFARTLDDGAFLSPADAPMLSLDRKRFEAVLYEPSTYTVTVLGQGISPFFVDETHVAWLAPAGLAMADLTSGETRVIAADTGGRVPAVTLLSPDHSVVAWYAAGSKDLVLYRVTAAGAEALAPVSLPTPLRSLALGNDAVYFVRSATLSAEVLKQPLAGGEPVSVVKLPATMRINRLLFGSI